jgi:hypothetical protein
MEKHWFTLKDLLFSYLNYENSLESNLKNRMTYLHKLMEKDISEVQDMSQLKHWTLIMLHNSLETETLLDLTPNTNFRFRYKVVMISIKPVVKNIIEKIEILNETLKEPFDMVDIQNLKQDFVSDDDKVESIHSETFRAAPGDGHCDVIRSNAVNLQEMHLLLETLKNT